MSVYFGMRKVNNSKGFTLVEILVVLAIIAILVSIVVFGVQDAKKKARDKTRRNDLQSLQLTIELYKQQYGRYPANCESQSSTKWAGPGTDSMSAYIQCDTNYIAGVVPDFIAALPESPSNEYVPNKGYMYRTNSTGTMYKLVLVNAAEADYITTWGDPLARCPAQCDSSGSIACQSSAPNANDYAVYSAGAECW